MYVHVCTYIVMGKKKRKLVKELSLCEILHHLDNRVIRYILA